MAESDLDQQLFAFAQAVKAAGREFERRFNDLMRPLGITAAQAEALVIIHEQGPLALKDLGERIIAESGHPSRLVDRLVDAGHVRRTVPETNRRRVELTLTDQGLDLIPHIHRAHHSMVDWGKPLIEGQDLPAALAALHAVLRDSPLAAVLQPPPPKPSN